VLAWQQGRTTDALAALRGASSAMLDWCAYGFVISSPNSPERSATPSAPPTRPPPPSQPDRMLHQEAAMKFYGERVILSGWAGPANTTDSLPIDSADARTVSLGSHALRRIVHHTHQE
jgi:hypothetical protein